jgi:hypothetical protein
VKLFGTKSLVSLGQHICCTNQIASKVVGFHHMGIKVHINYVCQPSKWNLMFNSLIYLFANIMPHQMKGIRNGKKDV